MMGRSPCCDSSGLKKGPWTPEEDDKLVDYIEKHGHGSWRALPKLAGLNRCGKSCRLRWTNYLRPDIKRGKFTQEEEQLIINLHSVLGNKWSAIATRLPGRTDNEIKNFWNTHLKKQLLQMGIDPVTHRPRTDHLNINLLANLPQLLAVANTFGIQNLIGNNSWPLPSDHTSSSFAQIAKIQLLNNILQVLNSGLAPNLNSGDPNGLLESSSSPLFRQHHLNEYLNNNTQFQGDLSHELFRLATTQEHTNCTDHHHQSNMFPNLETSQEMALPAAENVVSNGMSSSFSMNSSSNQLPALVSASPECSQIKMMNKKNIDVSNPSSTTSTTFEANWGELMEDEASDSYWKDIIEQASSQPWPTL